MDKDLLENSEFKEEMLKYTFALNRLTSELEILLEEYKFKNEYNPVEHIKTRIKSFSSIKDIIKSVWKSLKSSWNIFHIAVTNKYTANRYCRNQRPPVYLLPPSRPVWKMCTKNSEGVIESNSCLPIITIYAIIQNTRRPNNFAHCI